MRSYPSCPNCSHVAESGAPATSLYKCDSCGTKYCTRCGGTQCPQCGEEKRLLVGKVSA